MLNWLLTVNFQFKNQRISKWMRDTSLIIYIVHPMIIYLLDLAGLPKGILHWLTVTILSISAAAVLVLVKNKLKTVKRKNSAGQGGGPITINN